MSEKQPNKLPYRYFLDKFSDADLRKWLQLSKQLDGFHIRQHYYFAGERYARYGQILKSLQAVRPINVVLQEWTRITDYEYSLCPLSTQGSLIAGGRFNIGDDVDRVNVKSFPALYVAEDQETAHQEKFCKSDELTANELALRIDGSYTCFILKGTIHNIFDLTKKKNLAPFVNAVKGIPSPKSLKDLYKKFTGKRRHGSITTVDELHDNLMDPLWRAWPLQQGVPANSQVFGQMLIDAGFSGVLYQSTKGAKKCCAIFTETLPGTDTIIEVVGNPPEGATHLRIDGSP